MTSFSTPTVTRMRRVALATAVVAAGSLALAGCGASGDGGADGDDSSASNGEWPRTFENADGTTTEIPEQPQEIFSTTVSTTGTLLAIDAPVAVSATDANGEFFPQWADVAEEKGVEEAWAAGAPDIEAAIAAEPDLIVVATTGQDSVVDQVAEFQDVAPTIVVDYGEQSWEDLAVELGEATGLEEQAQTAIDEFDTAVADAAEQITVPEGEANIVSYNGPGNSNPIAHADGPHGTLLQDLGFTIEEPDAEWHTQPQPRKDFVFADYERLTELTADTTFVLAADDAAAEEGFGSDEVLANLPSVENDQVYGLGANSFRMDLYSATEIVEGIVDTFGS
ncbi:MAG: Fe2+-enterobactin ABC transporter substrate-binding protein [Microbacterium sp.]